MTRGGSVSLTRDGVDAVVLPDEGGVLTHLRVDGRPVLASTPWAHDLPTWDDPAQSESEWVERWRGGWQLCFPSAGEVDSGSRWPQAFHGVASQSPWHVVAVGEHEVSLVWEDEFALAARRTWTLTRTGARVETVVTNGSTVTRPVVVAEHLILGGDVLAPVVDGSADLWLTPPAGMGLATLSYSGHPDGDPQPWPGHAVDRWSRVGSDTPARVAAMADVAPGVIRIDGPHVAAAVSWVGLPHALLWEELAQSAEPPWNRSVIALGIEPTSAAHGLGTALPEGTISLAAGDSLTWSVALSVEWLRRDFMPEQQEEQ